MYCANMKMRSDILIHDGFWASDLNSLANKILFWHRKSNRLLLQYGWGDDEFQRAQHHLAKYAYTCQAETSDDILFLIVEYRLMCSWHILYIQICKEISSQI
jgi:hypothetical protein